MIILHNVVCHPYVQYRHLPDSRYLRVVQNEGKDLRNTGVDEQQ